MEPMMEHRDPDDPGELSYSHYSFEPKLVCIYPAGTKVDVGNCAYLDRTESDRVEKELNRAAQLRLEGFYNKARHVILTLAYLNCPNKGSPPKHDQKTETDKEKAEAEGWYYATKPLHELTKLELIKALKNVMQAQRDLFETTRRFYVQGEGKCSAPSSSSSSSSS